MTNYEADTYHPDRYWSERLSRYWSLQGVGYIGYGERYNRYLYRAKVRALRTAVEAHGIEVRGRAVLDLGPGIG
ncbi:MAG TPA: hypothetical protein VF158_01385, partial [Longimicrobiales bacterium]